jgi:acetylornithine deacetylase/succinyl-diaminopimelate desuccinylase-like protein
MFDPVEVLQDLIRIDTTNPPGRERPAVALLGKLLRDAGIATEEFAKDPERPNLIARIPGSGDAPPLLLQGHVDVVSTAGQRWDRDPFGAEIVDGYLWGRGTLDMKGPVVMMVHALAALAASDHTPAGDIILAVVADEENHGDVGARFLVENHADQFAGVRYCIGEFGGFPFQLGDTTFYPIQVAERVGVKLQLTIRGTGGHGSLPHRGGTTATLGKVLTALDRRRMPVHIVPATRLMLEAMSAHTTGAVRAAIRGLLDHRTAGLTLRALRSRLEVLEPVLRNTVSATVLRGGDKHNVIPAEIHVTLDGRMLPGLTPDVMVDELRSIVGPKPEIEYSLDGAAPAAVDPDLGLFDLLAGLVVEHDPTGVPIPFLLPAVTDGRWFAQLGIQPYGFTPLMLPHDFEFQSVVHAANERVPVDAIRMGSAMLYDLLIRYRG